MHACVRRQREGGEGGREGGREGKGREGEGGKEEEEEEEEKDGTAGRQADRQPRCNNMQYIHRSTDAERRQQPTHVQTAMSIPDFRSINTGRSKSS